ncbi:MAG: TIGR03790 family protein [Verrucomicrobia bacterium]|nr:TIGR03790 family protein [Verrucomicrobiota bacterium]
MKRLVLTFLVQVFFAGAPTIKAAGLGDSVVVIYNQNVPESKALADYYAQRREIPREQIFGFDLPATEIMSRREFREQLEQPLLKNLEAQRLWSFTIDISPATPERPGQVVRKFAGSRIRYAVLCYGVPLRIAEDASLLNADAEKVRPELRRNTAAVESELAVLPLHERKPPLYGPLRNPFYGITNAAPMDPANGILLTARLDGPSPEIARGLIDKALQAERDGLWGRAYFDARGLTSGDYKRGDDWILRAEKATRQSGFETELDASAEIFPAGYPMGQVALYAGWYAGQVAGPFTSVYFDFVPGAFAYHLHSFSAATIRSATQNWVAPLLAKGATATMGCVDEPYLEGTPDLGVFFERFLAGFTFGEAAYASQTSLSWQTTVIGDPLYRPFGATAAAREQATSATSSQSAEWSQLAKINQALLAGQTTDEACGSLEKFALAKRSAVLQEKLGNLHAAQKRWTAAVLAYRTALKLEPVASQRLRVSLRLAETLLLDAREEESFAVYRKFVNGFPVYPDLPKVYEKLVELARKLGRKDEAVELAREAERVSAARP